MKQSDYSEIVHGLDEVLKVFEEITEKPEEAMKAFIENHYFSVWRAIKGPRVPSSTEPTTPHAQQDQSVHR